MSFFIGTLMALQAVAPAAAEVATVEAIEQLIQRFDLADKPKSAAVVQDMRQFFSDKVALKQNGKTSSQSAPAYFLTFVAYFGELARYNCAAVSAGVVRCDEIYRRADLGKELMRARLYTVADGKIVAIENLPSSKSNG